MFIYKTANWNNPVFIFNTVIQCGDTFCVLVFLKQCPIEWFHFACVDLTTKPKGKW